MLKDIAWPKERLYRSGSNREPLEFYLDALSNSNRLDLLLGYFSFTTINVLSLGFARFLFNGGRLRVVANQIFSAEDKATILNAMDPDPKLEGLIDLSNIDQLKYSLDSYGKHFFECLAWLIANDRIEIVIVKPKGKKGIAHYKSGIFSDGFHRVKFKASCNFTTYGLMENLEELDVDLEWEDQQAKARISEQNKYFEEIFSGKADYVEYLPADKIEVAIRDKFGDKEVQELIVEEAELIRLKSESSRNPKIQRVLKKLEDEVDEISRKPRFPYPDGPRKYQVQAYENWVKNEKQGIFAMATGTGKTLTSLNCLLKESEKSGTYKAVIVVPTIALVAQWKKECQKFNFQNIVTVSSKNKWGDELSFFNSASKFTKTSFIVITTYASFHRKKFQDHFKNLDTDTLFIADEAHNLGAGKVAKVLPKIHLKKRVGLSATIHRQYDDEGNEVIQQFFNDSPPFVITYSMQMALNKKWLCKYTYHPHLVELDSEEFQDYAILSRKLMNFFDNNTGRYKKGPEVEALLLARKRIIHKAKNKLSVFKEILQNEYTKKGHLKYSLIYVPEGRDPEYDKKDEHDLDEDDDKLIHAYTRAVSDIDFSVMVKQYTSNSSGRDELLKDFERGNLHVLTSMKCLDEGVDVPRSELAIFCASTGNPRQFIQRRGRVLRLHEDKDLAVIHDLVVVPKIDKAEDHYSMERSLVRKELERVVDFAFLSQNKMTAFSELEEVSDYYNLNLFDIHNNLK
ncbi:DEAD/DEAH box helicase family protein [Salibacter halophilus]|uniref:DEAD/DEAH box helicase n=1 Tax=Salibacter halophilus TaxID=1803916 RepID=A0A6N6M6R6_9FLAO|nr:DEAD/DEAH box helicase family protein [Salibacter halophilus]KAB1065604.1 DEAD/DEAH box helicase [Salibacter halophilus]